jgi:hypothetical protein
MKQGKSSSKNSKDDEGDALARAAAETQVAQTLVGLGLEMQSLRT